MAVNPIELRIGRLVIDTDDPETAQRVVDLVQDALRRLGERLALDQASSVTTQHEISLDRLELSPLSLAEADHARAVEQLTDDLYTRITFIGGARPCP